MGLGIIPILIILVYILQVYNNKHDLLLFIFNINVFVEKWLVAWS